MVSRYTRLIRSPGRLGRIPVLRSTAERFTGAEIQAVCTRAALAAVGAELAVSEGTPPGDPVMTPAHLEGALAGFAPQSPVVLLAH